MKDFLILQQTTIGDKDLPRLCLAAIITLCCSVLQNKTKTTKKAEKAGAAQL